LRETAAGGGAKYQNFHDFQECVFMGAFRRRCAQRRAKRTVVTPLSMQNYEHGTALAEYQCIIGGGC